MNSESNAQPVSSLAEAICAGDRRALAKAITLVESSLPADRVQAECLIATLLPETGKALRLGLSGVPGAGKSTLIEALGLKLTAAGHRLAVLAVDPTSARTGGSILGDKTRMELLAADERAFIRPSPAGLTLGGVARRTRDALLLCEAAGYDMVIIETVGVGQSEAAVADLVDLFVLLLVPGAGDELQGIKRGVLELADLIVVNKADGELASAANHAAAEYRHALTLLRPLEEDWSTPVFQISAQEGRGLDALWHCIAARHKAMKASGLLAARRSRQAQALLRREIELSLIDELRADAPAAARLRAVEQSVAKGDLTPGRAAAEVLAAFRSRGT